MSFSIRLNPEPAPKGSIDPLPPSPILGQGKSYPLRWKPWQLCHTRMFLTKIVCQCAYKRRMCPQPNGYIARTKAAVAVCPEQNNFVKLVSTTFVGWPSTRLVGMTACVMCLGVSYAS